MDIVDVTVVPPPSLHPEESQQDHTSLSRDTPPPDSPPPPQPSSPPPDHEDDTLVLNSSSSSKNSHDDLESELTGIGNCERVLPPTLLQKSSPAATTTHYQLTFGLEDTSSDTSLTDSPQLVRTLQSSSIQQKTGMESHSMSGSRSQQTGMEPQSMSGSRSESSQDGPIQRSANLAVATDGQRSESSYSGTTISSDSAMPIRGEVVEANSTPLGGGQVAESTSVTEATDSNVLVNGGVGNNSASSSQDPEPSHQRQEESSDALKHENTRQKSDSQSSDLKLEDITLRSRSTSLEETTTHPLSLLTEDDETREKLTIAPPYSPIPNTSGDEDCGSLPSSPSFSSPNNTAGEEDVPVMTVLFSGITYLGSSSVDAPISEIEANRKMHVLKEQAVGSEPIPVVLSVPVANSGCIVLKDPKTDQPMATFSIKTILFCARGNAEVLLDCFCFNVRNKRSGLFQCHVFRTDTLEICDKVFKAIGKAFTTKVFGKDLPPLTGDTIKQDFLVSLDVHEDDGKGGYSPVPMDKDCFKLRQNTKKKLTLSVSQPGASRPILITRCFGLLVSPGRDVKVTEMNLLDNMNPSPNAGASYVVSAIWEPNVSFLASLNEETPKSVRYQYLSVASDLILESVTEPVRFKREVKVHVSKGGITVSSFLNQLTKKKQGPMDQLLFTLKLKKSEGNSLQQPIYQIEELRPKLGPEVNRLNDEVETRTPSPTQKHRGLERIGSIFGVKSGSIGSGASSRDVVATESLSIPPASKSQDDPEDSDIEEEDDDFVVSGWGDNEGIREDLLKDWGEVLEHWDGKDRARPSRVVKLCRKGIPRHLRCQVWQMLTGAAHDPQLAEAYRLLLSKESPAENVINWDIKRTYVGHGYFQEPSNRNALYKISKAYSVYDEEVGYCQGFSFMAAVLLLQKMPEETAFSVLVKIMYNYGHRNIFKANFHDLHLMFYQLDRLVEEFFPDLHQHMQENRIETHMFASQWFLTLFTAKFPLTIVFRILDIYLCERIVAIFQVALSLLKVSRKELMALDFEGILAFFRVTLPKKFQSEEDCQYLFSSMSTIKVSEKKLAKLQRDYQSFLEQQALLEDPVMRLERANKSLRDQVHRLEQENDNLAQDLVGSKIKLRTEMDKLEERIDSLSKEARTHKASHDAAQHTIGELKEELKQAKDEFQRIMMKLTEEKQQYEGTIAEYKQVFKKLDEGHQKQKEELNQELLEVKAKLGSNEEFTDSLSSEQRLRNLELELAQTKLALVESQCKNQELEHKVAELSSGKSKKWYSDLAPRKK